MMIKKEWFWGSSLFVLALDQLSKLLMEFFKPNWGLIKYAQNTGAGFGLFKGYTFLLALVSLVVAVAVLVNYKKIDEEKFPQVLWGLFLGGTMGNLIDRLFRGYVVDFIDVGFWPSFNLADACISISVVGLVWYYWKK